MPKAISRHLEPREPRPGSSAPGERTETAARPDGFDWIIPIRLNAPGPDHCRLMMFRLGWPGRPFGSF